MDALAALTDAAGVDNPRVRAVGEGEPRRRDSEEFGTHR
jgi:hypothetical protein